MAPLIKMKYRYYLLSAILSYLFLGCIKSNVKITKYNNGNIETVQIIEKENNTVYNYIFDMNGDLTNYIKVYYDSLFAVSVGYKNGQIKYMLKMDTSGSNPKVTIFYTNSHIFKAVIIHFEDNKNGIFYKFDSSNSMIKILYIRNNNLLASAEFNSGSSLPFTYQGDSLLIKPYINFNSDSARKIERMIGGKLNKVRRVKDLKFRIALEETE